MYKTIVDIALRQTIKYQIKSYITSTIHFLKHVKLQSETKLFVWLQLCIQFLFQAKETSSVCPTMPSQAPDDQVPSPLKQDILNLQQMCETGSLVKHLFMYFLIQRYRKNLTTDYFC